MLLAVVAWGVTTVLRSRPQPPPPVTIPTVEDSHPPVAIPRPPDVLRERGSPLPSRRDTGRFDSARTAPPPGTGGPGS